VRAHAVSGAACARVGERLRLADRLRAAAPADGGNIASLLETQKFLGSGTEAVIGACFLHFGFEQTARAVADAFAEEIERAVAEPADFKSEL
ncbi:hypothetical protein OFM36_32515, partial [Escherichia coli]|nr:hypothetical protein [Escherichia coli]